MPLIYAAAARGSAVLAEYSVFAGNFNPVAKDYFSKSHAGGRFTYTVDNHVFSFLLEDGYSECCVAVMCSAVLCSAVLCSAVFRSAITHRICTR